MNFSKIRQRMLISSMSFPSSFSLVETFRISGAYVVPKSDWYKIELQGASGTGSIRAGRDEVHYTGAGGGGGGCAISIVKLKKGDTVIYNLGAYNPTTTADNPTSAKAGDSTVVFSGSGTKYAELKVEGAYNGLQPLLSIARGGEGGKASGGNFENFNGNKGENGKSGPYLTTIEGGAGGTPGYQGGNDGGNGQGTNSDNSYIPLSYGKNAFIKIYRGN